MPDQLFGRILVVDDESELREALVSTLNRLGHEAVGIAVGQDALKLLESESFDILLSDLMMPGMDGLTLLRKSLALDPNLIVLMMTGQGSVSTAIDAIKGGAFDYLLKPFKVQSLLPSLTRALEVRRLRVDNVQLRESVAIYELSQTFASTLDLSTIIEKTAEASLRQWEADEVSILLLLVTSETDELQIAAVRGQNRMELIGQRMPLNQGIAGWVARHHEPVVLSGAVQDSRFESLHPRPELQASVSMPMLANNQLVGVLNVNALRRPRPFTPGQVKALSLLANIAAAAIQNAQLHTRLREDEERFRALIENSSDAITLLNAEGQVVYDSPAAPGLLGYSSPELVGQNVFEHIHSDDRAAVQAQLEQLLKTEAARFTAILRFRHKNGAWRWLEGTATNLLDKPRIRAVVLNYHDITERKQAEERLSEALIFNQTIIDTSPIGIVTYKDSGEAVSANEAIAHIIGTTVAQVRAQNFRDLDSWKTSGLLAAADELLASGQTQDIESQLVTTFGKSISLSSRFARFYHRGEPHILGLFSDITARKTAEQQIRTQFDRLTALLAIDTAITASIDLGLTLKVLLDQVIGQLKVDAADVLILNPNLNMLECAAGRGFRTRATSGSHFRLGQGNAGQAALDRRPIRLPNLDIDNPGFARADLLAGENFRAYYAMPLVAKGIVKGVLEIFHRTPLETDSDWLDFLETLARQAAIAIDNAELFTDLQRSNTELLLAYDTTIEGWSRALDLRDKETEGHSQRVTEMALTLARALGLTENELVHLRRGALLHDIGKMGVPDGILLKPDPLTDEEWVAMKKHPTFAYEMLTPISYLKLALDIPYCHHEKWDGSGYPRGLKGAQIPLPARIFAVVDVFDAVSSDRPYRAAWQEGKVREHIRALSGTHFDPQVADMFLKLFNNDNKK